MAKIIVTGGAGFIGSHIVMNLVSNDHDITVIDDLSTGQQHNVPDNVKLVVASLENIDPDIFKGIEIVYHLASIAGESVSLFAPDACYKRNIIGSYNVLINSLKSGVRRLVFTSSMAVYGNCAIPPFSEDYYPNPTDPYGLSKYEMEKLLEIYGNHTGLEWVCLRLHNVYGPHMNLNDPYRGVVGILISLLLRGKAPVLYGNGDHIRAFTFIDDITPYLVQAGFDGVFNRQVLNLGSDEITTLANLANTLIELLDFDGRPNYFPERPGEMGKAYPSHEKSKSLFGFSAETPLNTGLKKTISWAKQQNLTDFNYDLMKTEFELEEMLPSTWKNRLL